MPNGRQYAVLSGDFLSAYFRKESAIVYVYDIAMNVEHPCFDFSKAIGDTVAVWQSDSGTMWIAVYDKWKATSVDGSCRPYMVFVQYSTKFPDPDWDIIVEDSLGITKRGTSPYYELEGAVINGREYGRVPHQK